MILSVIISSIFAYLLGSVNTSIIVSKVLCGSDIRKFGSGNAGATNTLRTLGKKAAVFVVLGDGLKGVLAVLAARFIESLIEPGLGVSQYYASVFVVLGHIFPLFFGFRGGKGIMTSIAVILVLDYKIGLILLSVFIVVVVLSNYISLSSCIAALFYPVMTIWFHTDNIIFISSSFAVAIMAILKHRTNIKRLINGNESKFIKKKVR